MADPHYTPSGQPTQGSFGASSVLRAEFGLIEAGIQEMNKIPVTVTFEDANSDPDRFIVIPWSANIIACYAAIGAVNGGSDTILTPKIAGVAVTDGGMTISSAAAVGAVVSSTPTAANSVTAGGTVEIESDNAGSTVMPVTVTLLLRRT